MSIFITLNDIAKDQTHQRCDLQFFDKLEGKTKNGVPLKFNGVIVRYYDDIFYFHNNIRDLVFEMYTAEVEYIESKKFRRHAIKCFKTFGTWGGFRFRDVGQFNQRNIPVQLDAELHYQTLNEEIPSFTGWVVNIEHAGQLLMVAKALRLRTERPRTSSVDWRFLWMLPE